LQAAPPLPPWAIPRLGGFPPAQTNSLPGCMPVLLYIRQFRCSGRGPLPTAVPAWLWTRDDDPARIGVKIPAILFGEADRVPVIGPCPCRGLTLFCVLLVVGLAASD